MPSQFSSLPPEPPAKPAEPARTQPGRRWLRWLVRLGGTFLLLLFLWRYLQFDPARLLAELSQVRLEGVAAAIVLVVPFIGLKAWRWQTLLHDLGIPLDFPQSYRLYALGLSAGSFTPGQAGDLVKAWRLQQQGYSLGAGLISIVLDRLYDVAVLVLLAASGLIVLGAAFSSVLPGLLALLAGVALALVVLSVPRLRDRWLGLALKLFLRSKLAQAGLVENKETAALAPVRFVRVLWLTLLGSGLVLVRVWLLAMAVGLNLNILEVLAASSLATVASLLPVSVGGIGARDLVLAGILDRLGYPVEKAVTLATFILLLQLVNLLAGYFIWATRPRPLPGGETSYQ